MTSRVACVRLRAHCSQRERVISGMRCLRLGPVVGPSSRAKPSALPSSSVRAAGGRWSWAASCATGCSAARRRTSTSRSSASRRTELPRRPRARSGASSRSGRPSRSSSWAPIDVALPRRESKTGRGHKGFTVEGDPYMPFDEAARRRDFTINAIALGSADRASTSIRSAVAPTSSGASCASSTRALRRRLAARAARAAVRRALRADARARERAHLPRHRARRPARRAHLGRVREAAAASRSGRRSASPSRASWASSSSCCPSWCRSTTARRTRSGIPKATSGRTR